MGVRQILFVTLCRFTRFQNTLLRISVKKDDPPLELPSLPKIPKSLTEVWDSIKSSASSLISDKQEQTEAVLQNIEEKVLFNDPESSKPIQTSQVSNS